jgi:hypothetical protein
MIPPPSYLGANLTAALLNGTVSEAKVDDMVPRVLAPYSDPQVRTQGSICVLDNLK